MSIENDEDSLVLNVQPPKQEIAKNKSVLSSWEFKIFAEDPNEAKFFLLVSDIYLRNLINKVELPKMSEQQRKRLGSQCIIIQQFEYQWIIQDGVHRIHEPYRAQIAIYNIQYHGLKVVVRLGQLQIQDRDNIFARIIYQDSSKQISYKTFRMYAPDNGNLDSRQFLIDDKLFDQYFKPKLAIQFIVQKQSNKIINFRGIQNQGNTCYMNSTLQILYFLRPLRKAILQFQGNNHLMKTIKKIFIDLLDIQQNDTILSSVDASQLLIAYGRFPDPRKQQDIHQFLLGFLDQLQGFCPSLKQLWLGSGRQILTSRDPSKPYTNNINEDFSEIDLLLEDHKGNTLQNMKQSLKKLLEEQLVDDKIETDEYGKVDVGKIRQFTILPNVIFFNLKRYKYRKQFNKVVKILTDFEYPININLGFLQKTPTGAEQEDYTLYSVAVHRGQTYNSGHYYSFVNTSSSFQNPYWVKFNDSFVSQSSQQTALSFTGGKKKMISWSQEYDKFIDKQYIDEETAYLLVYIRNDKFREYQAIKSEIPRDWIIKRRQIQIKNSQKSQIIQVCIFEEKMDCDLFEEIPSFTIPLQNEQEIHKQFLKVKDMIGCKAASIWKVNRKSKKIKKLANFADLPQTPNRIFSYKRGHSSPDYLLIVPQSHKIIKNQEFQPREKLGVVCSVYKNEGKIIERKYQIICKKLLEDYRCQMERQAQKKCSIQQKDRFIYDWTDYCTLVFQ